MDSFTGPAPITNSNHPRNLGFTSTELPNERWRCWASQRASSSLLTEHVKIPLTDLSPEIPLGKTMALFNSAFPLGGYMSRTMLFIATISFLGCLTIPALPRTADGGRQTAP